MCWLTMKRRSSELLRDWKSGRVQIEGWSQLGGHCGRKYSVFAVLTGGRARGLAMEAGTRVQDKVAHKKLRSWSEPWKREKLKVQCCKKLL